MWPSLGRRVSLNGDLLASFLCQHMLAHCVHEQGGMEAGMKAVHGFNNMDLLYLLG